MSSHDNDDDFIDDELDDTVNPSFASENQSPATHCFANKVCFTSIYIFAAKSAASTPGTIKVATEFSGLRFADDRSCFNMASWITMQTKFLFTTATRLK